MIVRRTDADTVRGGATTLIDYPDPYNRALNVWTRRIFMTRSTKSGNDPALSFQKLRLHTAQETMVQQQHQEEERPNCK